MAGPAACVPWPPNDRTFELGELSESKCDASISRARKAQQEHADGDDDEPNEPTLSGFESGFHAASTLPEQSTRESAREDVEKRQNAGPVGRLKGAPSALRSESPFGSPPMNPGAGTGATGERTFRPHSMAEPSSSSNAGLGEIGDSRRACLVAAKRKRPRALGAHGLPLEFGSRAY